MRMERKADTTKERRKEEGRFDAVENGIDRDHAVEAW